MRTLFLVVTLVACWLGYHLHWIRQRHQWADEVQKQAHADGLQYLEPDLYKSAGEIRAPGMLWLFGERGFQHISLYGKRRWVENAASRALRLFPEARIWSGYSDDPPPAGPPLSPTAPVPSVSVGGYATPPIVPPSQVR